MTKKVPLQWKNGRLVPVMDTDFADFPGEEWKDIPDYEGVYQVSNLGRVKSLDRIVTHKNGKQVLYQSRMRKLSVRKHGETIILKMSLKKTGEKWQRPYSVSRMVYKLFVDASFDIHDLSVRVKRRDNDPLNCHCKNLFLEDAGVPHWEPVNQYDREGKFIQRYASASEAALVTRTTTSAIKDALAGKFLHAKKYFWRTGEPQPCIDISDWLLAKEQLKKAKLRPVQKLTLEGDPLEIYESAVAAAKSFSANRSAANIGVACANKNKTAYGYRWRYMDNDRNEPGRDATCPPAGRLQTSPTTVGNNAVSAYNRSVSQYDMKGVFVHEYASISKAAKALSISRTAISSAVKNEKVMLLESYWRYIAEPAIDVSAFAIQRERYFSATNKAVQQFNSKGDLIATHDSITSAGNAVNSRSSAISKACKSKRGLHKHFIWRYAEGS